MRCGMRVFLIAAVMLLPAVMTAQKFDGKWHTKLTCPAKGNTLGYTWEFDSTVTNNVLHGERGTVGEPAFFALDGTIKPDGKAKLSGSGIVASRKYARGVLAHEGAEYSYDVKAEFKEMTGSGVRDEGLGIVGRPCEFEFTKQ